MPTSVSVALDIGTTTIAGAGIDAKSGAVIAEASVANPQSRWGLDVLTRLNAIAVDPLLLDAMRRSVVAACNGIIKSVSGGSQVTEVSAAGNSVMEHLLLGVSPRTLLRPPYKPAFKDAARLDARQAGFDAADNAPLFVFPLIGGFVGGDAVAATLALGLTRSKGAKPPEGVSIAIDIGTNSEILLSVKGTIYAASAAAGPAFEAANISCGMTAQNGAIEEVGVLNGEIVLGVIGRTLQGVQYPPKGLCGSGLIDAASMLLTSGVVDSSGRIKSRAEINTNLSNRVIESPSENSFVLYRSASTTVTLTQQDIRNLQNAKAAIRAGIEVLLKKAGVTHSDVKKVYVAGAFGANLKPKSLAAIGILDEQWVTESAGDAALDGARLVLGSEERKIEAQDIARNAKYVSLSGSAHFEREFIGRLSF